MLRLNEEKEEERPFDNFCSTRTCVFLCVCVEVRGEPKTH
jgi:hypothetical protein